MSSVRKGNVVLEAELAPEAREKLIGTLLRIYRSYTSDQITSLVSRPKPLALIRDVEEARALNFIEALGAQGVPLRFFPTDPDAAPVPRETPAVSTSAQPPAVQGNPVPTLAISTSVSLETPPPSQTSHSHGSSPEMKTGTPEPPAAVQPESAVPAGTARTIAGFWRRLGAFLIDVVTLGIVGNLLCLVFFEPLARIGGLGRGIGFIIALLYFGIQNSSITGGQTIGKRALGIKVVDASGNPISPAKAHGRATVLILPHFLNMLQLPFLQMSSLLAMVLFVSGSVAVFGLGVGIVYLYTFNKRTRQSVHDLIFNTFVVAKEAREIRPVTEILWVHKAVVGCLLAATLMGPFFLGMNAGTPGTGLMKLFYDLGQTGKYTYIDIKDSRRLGGGPPFTSLNVHVWLMEKPETLGSAAGEIASLVFNTFPEVEARDSLAVTVGRGVDLGIGSISRNQTFHRPPMEWERQLEAPSLMGPDSIKGGTLL